ncbi:Uncharacterised protein [Vibrio cholerae]|nr:Uncharacterised protein [Vibrio cholerae]
MATIFNARAPANRKAQPAKTALAMTKMPPPTKAESPQSPFTATANTAAATITALNWINNNRFASSRPCLASTATMYSYL